MANILWSDKKRPLFGLPISFTKYTLTEEKLLVDTGFLSKSQEEIRLYRITDFSVRQGLFQRMFGVGDILITSSDNLQHNFVIRDIKKAYEIKEMLSDLVEKERENKGIVTNEFIKCDKRWTSPSSKWNF